MAKEYDIFSECGNFKGRTEPYGDTKLKFFHNVRSSHRLIGFSVDGDPEITIQGDELAIDLPAVGEGDVIVELYYDTEDFKSTSGSYAPSQWEWGPITYKVSVPIE